MGFHIEFAKFSERKKSVKQIGIINILSTMASIFGPLLGALIISNYSFYVLFIIIIIILFISIIPLLFSNEFHESFDLKIERIFSIEKVKEGIPFFGEGFKDMSARVLWPILLYYLFTSLNGIGIIYTISSGILVLVTIYIGKKATNNNKKNILKYGTYIHGSTLVVRTLLDTITSIAFVQGIGGLSWAMVDLPFRSMFYNMSKKKGIGETIYIREFFLHIGRIASILTLTILIYFLNDKKALIINIILGALFLLLMNKIRE